MSIETEGEGNFLKKMPQSLQLNAILVLAAVGVELWLGINLRAPPISCNCQTAGPPDLSCIEPGISAGHSLVNPWSTVGILQKPKFHVCVCFHISRQLMLWPAVWRLAIRERWAVKDFDLQV